MSARPTFGPEGRLFPKASDFETEEELWDAIEEINRWNNGLPPGPKLLPPTLRRVRAEDELGTRQVGLRLPEGDYERLAEMSARYGLAPATLARMLVVRAVRSEVDEH